MMTNRQRRLRALVRGMDKAISNALLILLALVLLFCLYALYLNQRIVSGASSVQFESYKPTADDTLSFDELCAQNPDVIGWITIDDTNIDYPVVQGETNSDYINTDVFGAFSLSGALFLDYRNHPDIPDPLSIIYGHNMTGDAMFGGIRLFSDKSYFDAHRTGTLLLSGEYYRLEITAYLESSGYDTRVYAPTITEDEYADWLQKALACAKVRADGADMNAPSVLLSTCFTGRTDQRKLLLASIRPGGAPAAQQQETKGLERIVLELFSADAERTHLAPWFWLSVLLLILLTLWNIRYRTKLRKEANAHDGTGKENRKPAETRPDL